MSAANPDAVFEAHLEGMDCGQRPCGTCDPDVIIVGPPLDTGGATETTYIEVPEPALRALLDLAIHSLDFGSGFWDQEDCDVARFVADLLDVCPNAATPDDMLPKYPACPGVYKPYRTSNRLEHRDHDGEPA